MKNIKYVLSVLFVIFAIQSKSQTLSEVLSDQKTNYFEKNVLLNDSKSQVLENAENWEAKRYP